MYLNLVDETENERRRAECLDDMADLERQFVELKEQYVHVLSYRLIFIFENF